MAAIGSTPFDSLPDELIPEIASHFDSFDTHIRFSHTCRRFFGDATELDGPARKLIEYTAKRPPIQSEGMVFFGSHHLPAIQRSQEAEIQMQLFYDSFKKRMSELHIGTLSEQFFTATARATRLFTLSTQPSASLEQEPPRTARAAVERLLANQTSTLLSDIRKGTLTTRFKEKAVEDAVETYARQPLGAITPSSMYKMIDFVNISIDLIAKMVLKHHSKEQIEAHRQGFLDKSPNAPRFLAAQESIGTDLICQRQTLQERMALLPGEIEKESENRKLVQMQAEARMAASASRLGAQVVPMLWATRPSENRAALERALAKLLEEFDEASLQKENAASEHQKLLDELRDIPGKLSEIEKALASENLKQAARDECEKMAQFYEEFFLKDS